MKKIFVILSGFFLFACTSDQGGVVDDGIHTVDSNGALIDSTPNEPWDPSIDTSMLENRVDLQIRDTSPGVNP